MSHWYLDALDPRAGHAFASYRDPDLDRDEIDLDATAVFIGAPHFRAESLSSRAIGFAAASGSAQFGFFAERAEIGFPSLEGLIEFVRRAYLAGGAGDGGGGIGPAPPGPPEGGDGPAPGGSPEPMEPGGGVRALTDAASSFAKCARSIDMETIDTRSGRVVETTLFHGHHSLLTGIWPFTSSMSARRGGHNERSGLARGAALILAELLARAPPPGEFVRDWHVALHSLAAAILRLDLLAAVVTDSTGVGLHARAQLAFKRNPEIFGVAARGAWDDEFLIFHLLGFVPSDWRVALDFYHDHVRPGSLALSYGRAGADHDLLDVLSTWPLPPAIAKGAGLGGDGASVRDLLCAFLANPALLVSPSTLGDETAMIILLGAAHLVSHISIGGSVTSTPIASAMIDAVVHDALAWLDNQMPKQVFAPDVERAIEQSGQFRYAAAW